MRYAAVGAYHMTRGRTQTKLLSLVDILEPLSQEGLEDLAARTSGEMHYVACVQVERRVLEVDGRHILVRTPTGYLVLSPDPVSRIQVFWTITVREIETGRTLDTETFEGGPPPPFPKGGASGGGDLEGHPPSQDVVRKWLLSVMQ